MSAASGSERLSTTDGGSTVEFSPTRIVQTGWIYGSGTNSTFINQLSARQTKHYGMSAVLTVRTTQH